MMFRVLALALALFFSTNVAAHHAAGHPASGVIREYVHPVFVKVPPRLVAPGLKPITFSSGTLVVLTPEYAVTAAHMVVDENAPNKAFRVVRIDGEERVIETVKVDTDSDVALVRGKFRCPCASLARETPYQDQEAYTVGYPALEATSYFITDGIQFVTLGHIQTKPGDKWLVATTVTSGGGSGGGMFVKEGNEYRLAGVVSSIATVPIQSRTFQELGWIVYATPVSKIKDLVKGNVTIQ